MDVDRGQAHTLEAFSAAIVLLASVLFALQVTAVTPLTASTASQHIENQQAGVAGGVLDSAAENGSLAATVLFWNDTAARFHNTSGDTPYQLGGPPTAFGEQLNVTFRDRGIAFDVTVRYVRAGSTETRELVDMGTASDNAVTVRRSLVLHDDDELYNERSVPNGTTVSEANTYFANDEDPDSPVFNVMQVELTLWRM